LHKGAKVTTHRNIKRAWKIVKRIGITLLVLVLIVAGLMLLPPVQTFLAKQATAFLQSKYNIDATIGRLAISLPNRIVLRDVFIADDQGDTLIYAQDLNVNYAGFDKERNLIKSTGIQLNNGRLYMYKHPEDSLFNFALFIEKLSGGEEDTTAEPFRMKVSDVEITNFRYKKERIGCVDSCTQMYLNRAKVHVKDFFLDGSYVTGEILHMQYVDEGRFQLHEFRAKVAYQPKYMALRELYFKTDESEIDADVVLQYDSPDVLEEFLNEVSLKTVFRKSSISSEEFRAYIPQFPDFDVFSVSGVFTGPVNDLTMQDALINMGENTRFFGDAHIYNPADSDLLTVNANVGELRTIPAELKKYIGQFTGEMDWMQLLDQFNAINYRGKYDGTIRDFSVEGTLRLDENLLVLDGTMKGFDNLRTTSYYGTLEARPVNLGKFFNQPQLGMAAFKTRVNGRGLTTETLNNKISAEVSYLDAYNYRYTNLQLNGTVSEQRFEGIATLRDPNAGLDFDGEIDFSQDSIQVDFRAKFTDVELNKIGFSEDSLATINLLSDIDFQIYQDSWWNGTIALFDITYEGEKRFYFFDSISVYSNNIDQIHTDRLTSKILDAELNGNYTLAGVYQAFLSEYQGFNRTEREESPRPPVDFTYRLVINNAEVLTDLFLPELSIEPNTVLAGLYMGDSDIFEMNLTTVGVDWKKTQFKASAIQAYHEDKRYTLNAEIGSMQVARQAVDSIKIDADFQNDSAWLSTSGIYRDSIDAYFRLAGYGFDSSTTDLEKYFVHLSSGRFNIGNEYFELNPENSIILLPAEIEMTNIGFYNKRSYISCSGFISKDPNKVLRLTAYNLDADLLDYALRYDELDFRGNLFADIVMSSVTENPKFAGTTQVDSLWVNNDYLGQLNATSNWSLETGLVDVNADIIRGTKTMFQATTSIIPGDTSSLDMNLHFDRFRLMWIDPFVEGIFKNVRGTVTGDVHVAGSFSDLETHGKLYLTQGALLVPYFNVDYGFSAQTEILVETDQIILPKTAVSTNGWAKEDQTTGLLGGTIHHQNFSNWSFDLKMETDNLLVLNTENSQEAYFYGKGYASGDFAISGPMEDLQIDVNITTQKGTEFKIPFSNPLNVSEQSFITYTGRNNVDYVVINPEIFEQDLLKPLGGLDININAKVTSDALIQLVMDETVGDIISGRSKGDLSIKIPHDGDMEMFGTVEITHGDYLFTMRNLINKKFSIVPGGTISWNGSPYEAVIDMRAKYTTRTTLTGMVTNNYDGQRVQVDLLMDLKGSITNPNISFAIDLPNSNPSYQEELNNRLSDPDRLNQQAFSLLIINSFWNETVSTESGFIEQGVSSNTMQMAAAQFTNFIAQGLGDYIDISVGYNTALDESMRDELEVGISKNFMDDRFTINSSIDVPVGTSTPNSTQNFAGDIELIYKITRDGRIRAKAFNRNNQDNPALDKLSPYTQGVGIFYQTSFNTYGDLYRKVFGVKPEEPDTTDNESEEPTED
jgi:hypothetical protein